MRKLAHTQDMSNTATDAPNAFFTCVASMADMRRAAGQTEDEIFESVKASLLLMMAAEG